MVYPNTPWAPEHTADDFPEEFKHMRSIPFDPRFPNTDQTRNCFTNYIDYKRCSKVRGEKYEACQYFKRASHMLCPNAWIAKWEEQIAAGTFPMNI